MSDEEEPKRTEGDGAQELADDQLEQVSGGTQGIEFAGIKSKAANGDQMQWISAPPFGANNRTPR